MAKMFEKPQSELCGRAVTPFRDQLWQNRRLRRFMLRGNRMQRVAERRNMSNKSGFSFH